MRVAIIGCGKQAPKHLNGFRKQGVTDLVVADADAGRASALAEQQGVRAVELDDVWADEEVSAVVIATPTRTHGPLIRRAIESGKDFLCEKPLCETLEEARAIEQLAKQHDRIGMVGFIYRSVPVFQKVRDYLSRGDAGPLGRLSLGLVRIGGRGSHEVWKHRKETGGGVVNEMLVHVADLAMWLFGAPVKVQVLSSELRRPRRVIREEEVEVDAEDFVLLRLEGPDGTAVYIEADMVTPAFTQRVEIQGEYGTLAASIQAAEPSYLFLSEPRGDLSAGKHELDLSGDLYSNQSGTFLKAVSDREAPAYASLGEACELMRVMDEVTNQIRSAQ